MGPRTRKSGIDAIGDVPWGTHFGLFYRTRQDLIDVLVPYFEAGLINNEFCIWVTSEPLNTEEAKACMAEALSDFDTYLDKGQIEIIPFTEWYNIKGVFDSERVLNGWQEKLRNARKQGFSGLRATGNGSWLEPGLWKDFIDYEQAINDVNGQYDMLGVCSYPLDKCDANDILDVVSTHQFVLTRRNGEWKVIEDQGHKKSRKALQESEGRFKAIYDRAAMGIAIADREGRIQDCNNAFQTMLGYSIDELRQKHFADITFPDDISINVGLFKRSVEGQIDKYQMEKRYVRKDGSLIWCQLTASVITDTNGDFKYSLAMIDDITERKQAEMALRESEKKFRVLAETSPAAIFLYQGEKYIYVNPMAQTMTGYSREELLTDDAWGWIHADFRDLVRERARRRQLGEQMPTRYEVKYNSRDGREGWVDFSAGLVQYGGKPAGLAMAFDITERNRAAEELKVAKAQAELYLDLMGHDISNMHHIALGYLELARDMQAGEEQAVFLDTPVEVLQRSAKLVSNVRKLQKLRDGMYQEQDVNVFNVLLETQREFEAVSDKTIKLRLNGFERCHVHANELLRDVFSNLVSNAIKHTGDRATIVVNLDVVEDNGRRYCQVIVEDDGPGIPDNFKAKIFNRALKGTDKAKGMGLGLYLVKSLVDSYGGRVWVEDRVPGDHKKGAKFIVMLPTVSQ